MLLNDTDKLKMPQTRLIHTKNNHRKVAKTPLILSLRLYPCFYYVKSSIPHTAHGAKGKQELEIRAVLYNTNSLLIPLLATKSQGSERGLKDPLSA